MLPTIAIPMSAPVPGGVSGKTVNSKKSIKMKKMKSFVLLSVMTVLLASCGSVKNVAYLQNSDYIDLSRSEFLYDARIMPKDVLTITVNTVNPEASAPYNLIVRSTLNNTSSTIGTTGGSSRPIWWTITVRLNSPCWVPCMSAVSPSRSVRR